MSLGYCDYITGNKETFVSGVYDALYTINTEILAISLTGRTLHRTNLNSSVDWQNCLLYGSAATTTVNWTDRILSGTTWKTNSVPTDGFGLVNKSFIETGNYSTVVRTTGAQSISGVKTFYDDVVITNINNGTLSIDFTTDLILGDSFAETEINVSDATLSYSSVNALNWMTNTLSGNWSTNTTPTTNNHIVNYGNLKSKTSHNFYTSFQPIGNSTTTETVLYSGDVSAGLLGTNGDSIEGNAAGTFAGSNSKRLRLYLGSDLIFDSTALAINSAADWALEWDIVRSGSSVQKCNTRLNTSFTSIGAYVDYAAGTQDLSSATFVKLTAQGDPVLGADNDIVGQMFKLKYVPFY